MDRKNTISLLALLLFVSLTPAFGQSEGASAPGDLKEAFKDPPDSARPGVYWYFMDGNMSRRGITNDLESMKQAGIGNLIFLEVNVGVPRGPVDFLSEEWQGLFAHAVREAQRLGIAITLGTGPGWTGSGGPWVRPEQSMQHLVASSIELKGPARCDTALPVPDPREPYFGRNTLDERLSRQWMDFYEDVAVLAYPTPEKGAPITDSDEKALYYRAPYTSKEGVKPFLPAPALFRPMPPGRAIDKEKIIDLTASLRAGGRITWDVPAGNWTIMRFGRRNNGAVTRPAPLPGLGFECDKFDTVALNAHFDEYIGKLLKATGPRKHAAGGWTMLHMDSWEMGAQNWTGALRQEFRRRRGYDLLPFLPAYTGSVVGTLEMSERFLWDLRETAQELVLENHAGHLKELGRRYGFGLSIEPYDMDPCADLELGSIADVPMGEFWSKGYGFNSSFSCIEATSVAHTMGRAVVPAESFTAGGNEAWKLYPAAVKNQGDWAFCTGMNRLVYHTFAHKPLADSLRPGMVMGPYGVHWDRFQTWWPMVPAYHRYITRCQFLLERGMTVADILYLTPEGAPHVFRPPPSAMTGNDTIPDRRGYNFDGCPPGVLISRAGVRDGRIVFPGGASYRLLVLPASETMTPELLVKIRSLVEDGATIIGTPPVRSPSLSGYPGCDERVRSGAQALWGAPEPPGTVTGRICGKGTIFWGGECSKTSPGVLYPRYGATAAILRKMRVPADFASSGPVRYTHRSADGEEFYFVANRTGSAVQARCTFRDGIGVPELWDPLDGMTRRLGEFSRNGQGTAIPLRFEPYQSFFVVFRKAAAAGADRPASRRNFPPRTFVARIQGPWSVSFDPKWGGPDSVTFRKLDDWSKRHEEGVRYYSGIAVYRKVFDLPKGVGEKGMSGLLLDLGTVRNIARVRLNGRDLGVVWTAPWQVDITDAVRQQGNALEIEVANLWPNRLIGDARLPDDGIVDGRWPDWLLKAQPRTSGRYSFTTYGYYKKDSPLVSSGLLGPVTLLKVQE